MAQRKRTTAASDFIDLAELLQSSSLTAFHHAMQTGQATQKLAHEMVAAGLASHEAAYRAMKEYANATNQIRQEHVKKSAEVTEKMLSTLPTNFDYPFKQEIEELHMQMMENTKKVFDFFTTPSAMSAARE